MVIRSEVYVNSVRFHVPYTLCDFSSAELDELRLKGPYTEPWEALLPALEPDLVQAKLVAFQMEYHDLLKAAIAAAGKPRQKVPLVTIITTLLGYPPDDPGGPTPMEWLGVIEKCNTQSHEDLRKIFKNGWQNSGLENPLIQILFWGWPGTS